MRITLYLHYYKSKKNLIYWWPLSPGAPDGALGQGFKNNFLANSKLLKVL